MSKRKLPGGCAANASKAACDEAETDDISLQDQEILASTTSICPAVHAAQQAYQLAQVQEALASPPRMVPKDSPAASFMQSSPTKMADTDALTCNLSLIPRDRWNKRRSLSAIVLATLPIQSKSSTVRRNVVLRDENDECTVTVWGNHTNILNENAIGRPVTLLRVCLSEFEGKIQVAMPKDCSVLLGNTAQTVPIVHWMQRVGTTAVSVLQVQYTNATNPSS